MSAIGRHADIPFKVTVLYNPVNQGYGGNQKIGYHYAIENGFDFVALLHGDGQYAPEMLGTLTEPLRQGEADAVFGSRMLVRGMRSRAACHFTNTSATAFSPRCKTGCLEPSSPSSIAVTVSTQSRHSRRSLSIAIRMSSTSIQRSSSSSLSPGKRIKEIAIPTYYGDEICRVDGLKYAFNVIKASLQAWSSGDQSFL